VSAEWYQSNRAKVLADKKVYYAERREALKQKQRDYREANAEKVRAKDRERGRIRRADTEQVLVQRQRAKDWYYRNRSYALEKTRAARLMKDYGMTLEQYDSRCAAQGNRCAICRRHSDTLPSRLVIDHCHDTGIVRGLLCDDCNMAIGRLGDTAANLAAAYSYLVKFEDGVQRIA